MFKVALFQDLMLFPLVSFLSLNRSIVLLKWHLFDLSYKAMVCGHVHDFVSGYYAKWERSDSNKATKNGVLTIFTPKSL
jgi:hypothetical protein